MKQTKTEFLGYGFTENSIEYFGLLFSDGTIKYFDIYSFEEIV